MKTTVLCDHCGKEVPAHECVDPEPPEWKMPDPVTPEAPDAAFRALLDAFADAVLQDEGSGYAQHELNAVRARVEDAYRQMVAERDATAFQADVCMNNLVTAEEERDEARAAKERSDRMFMDAAKTRDEARAERDRLAAALRETYDAMLTWFSGEYAGHPIAHRARAALRPRQEEK